MKRGYAVVYSETSELTPDEWRVLAGVLREKHRRESEHLLYNSDMLTGENTMSVNRSTLDQRSDKPMSERDYFQSFDAEDDSEVTEVRTRVQWQQLVNLLPPDTVINVTFEQLTDEAAARLQAVDIPLNLGAPDDEDTEDT